MSAKELFEDLLFATVRNPNAAVQDVDLDIGQRRCFLSHINGDFLGVVRILLRVGKQIHDHLRQGISIPVHPNGRCRQVALDLKSIRLELWTITLDRVSDDLGDIALLELVLFLAAIDTGKIEDIVDKPREPGRLGRDDAEVGTLAFGVKDPSLREQFLEHANRGQRSL